MRAAVIHGQGDSPVVEDFPDPVATENNLAIKVSAGAIGPTDLMRVAGFFGPVNGPFVAGGEGAGTVEDGSRVYFGHAVPPFGAWGEKAVVPAQEVWPIPNQLSVEMAICLGISGTGAYIPLKEAEIQTGESVLILGATGPLGQIALQLAKRMGAGTVTAAARNLDALLRIKDRGFADNIVQLSAGDDLTALKAVAGDGFNVVLDVIFGEPASAALRATAPWARMMSIGVQAGTTMTLSLGDLVFRKHIGVGTGQRPAEERRQAFETLLAMACESPFTVDHVDFSLDQAADAWTAQAGSPHGKIILHP